MAPENRDVLRKFGEYFAKRDLDGMLSLLAPDVVWEVPGPERVPYCGTYAGHTGFVDFWTRLTASVHITDSGVDATIGDGDEIALIGWEQGFVELTGEPYRYRWAQEYRFTPEHLIGGMRQFFDPASVLEAIGAQPLPSIPKPFSLPFYYASLVHCEVLYLVDPGVVEPFLEGTGLVAARFGTQACTGFNYQMYAGAYDTGGAVIQELELNIVAYPAHRADQVAQVDFRQFVDGDEQSKLLGNHRVWVPCDDDIAIAAGEQLFGEPKFKTSFSVDLPVLNAPGVQTWSVTVNDPALPGVTIFTCDADLSGLAPEWTTPSPFTEYGTHDGMIGCRWNVLGAYETYELDRPTAGKVTVTYGTSTHPMRAALEQLVGDRPAAVVRTLQSQPAAIQSRAYRP